jgi:hypothetical protein
VGGHTIVRATGDRFYANRNHRAGMRDRRCFISLLAYSMQGVTALIELVL